MSLRNECRCKVVKQLVRNPNFRGAARAATSPMLLQPVLRKYTTLHQCLDSRGKQRWTAESGGKLDAQDVYYGFGFEQLTCNIDGFTIWLCAKDASEGRMVCVKRGEHMESLRRGKKQLAWDKRDKLNCMAIIMPGEGVVDIAVMHGGTKMRSGTAVGNCKLWTQQIVEKRIYGTETVKDAAGTVQPKGQQVQDQLEGIEYKVHARSAALTT